jgi:hypothetical protein
MRPFDGSNERIHGPETLRGLDHLIVLADDAEKNGRLFIPGLTIRGVPTEGAPCVHKTPQSVPQLAFKNRVVQPMLLDFCERHVTPGNGSELVPSRLTAGVRENVCWHFEYSFSVDLLVASRSIRDCAGMSIPTRMAAGRIVLCPRFGSGVTERWRVL